MTDTEVKEFMEMVDCLNLTTLEGIKLVDYIEEFDKVEGNKDA